MCADHHGWIQNSTLRYDWYAHAWRTGKPWAPRYGYSVHRGDEIVGAVLWTHRDSDARIYDVDVLGVVATDREAWRAVLALVASHGTTVETVCTALPDALLDLFAMTDWWGQHFGATYMMRLLDVPAAVAAWGVPSGRSGRIELEVVDREIESNAGNWVVEVADGAATVEAGGSGRVKIGAPALGALLAGYLTPGALLASGRVHGDRSDIETLGIFAAGPVGAQVHF